MVRTNGLFLTAPLSAVIQIVRGGMNTAKTSRPKTTRKHKRIPPTRNTNTRRERTHQVALVEQQQQVLVARVLAQVALEEAAARALGVARVEHLFCVGLCCFLGGSVSTLSE